MGDALSAGGPDQGDGPQDQPVADSGHDRRGESRDAPETFGEAAHGQIPRRRMMSPKFSPEVRVSTFSQRAGA
jgi:hypothetical protein